MWVKSFAIFQATRLRENTFLIILYTQSNIMNKRNILVNKDISLVLFSKGPQFVVSWEIDGETYTQRGDFFLSHIFFQEPGGANACIPLQAEMPLIGCLPLAWQRFTTLCLNLTVWFSSRGLLLVTHLLYPTALFTNHNVTACQSTWGH